MELFRYRSFERGIQEIKEQTIYFAPRETLNDPVVEGFLNVYWQGDRIAWNGLLRNYVCSLYHAIMLYLLEAKDEEIEKSAVLVDIHGFDDVPAGTILEKMGDKFLQRQIVNRLAFDLSENETRISRDELMTFLYAIHRIALLDVLKAFIDGGYNEESMVSLYESMVSSTAGKKIPSLKTLFEEKPNVRQKILHELLNIYKDKFDRQIISIANEQKKTWISVACNYPRIYIERLEDLIHPETYIACFSASENSNAMWGQYADNHTGVCLIYDTHTKGEDEYIRLYKAYGVSSSGTHYEYIDEKFYPVNYGGEVSEANFFTMLGRFTGKELQGWLSDKSGNYSCCFETIHRQEDKWRQDYWQCLYDRYCHKTKEWEYENEYRLLLVNFLFDYTNFESRKIKYNFSDLKGVILGAKMSPDKRAAILEAVESQCDKYDRDDFKIYVAEYDHSTDSIIKRLFYK